MIKTNIGKGNEQQVIVATGGVPELLTDVALLIGGIYTQFKNASPETAEDFRNGIVKLVSNPDSPMWRPLGNQTGIIFPKIDPEE